MKEVVKPVVPVKKKTVALVQIVQDGSISYSNEVDWLKPPNASNDNAYL